MFYVRGCISLSRLHRIAMLATFSILVAVTGCSGPSGPSQAVRSTEAAPSASTLPSKGAGCLDIIRSASSLQAACPTLVVRVTAQQTTESTTPIIEQSTDGVNFTPLAPDLPLTVNLVFIGWWTAEWKFDTSRATPIAVLRGDGGSVEEGENATEGKKPLSSGVPLYFYAAVHKPAT